MLKKLVALFATKPQPPTMERKIERDQARLLAVRETLITMARTGDPAAVAAVAFVERALVMVDGCVETLDIQIVKIF